MLYNNKGCFMKTMIRFFKNEEGATAIEYGLIAALISVAAIAAMTSVGTQLSAVFTTVQTSLAR
jgi:pilus assembly protein Flp/PilA